MECPPPPSPPVPETREAQLMLGPATDTRPLKSSSTRLSSSLVKLPSGTCRRGKWRDRVSPQCFCTNCTIAQNYGMERHWSRTTEWVRNDINRTRYEYDYYEQASEPVFLSPPWGNFTEGSHDTHPRIKKGRGTHKHSACVLSCDHSAEGFSSGVAT